MKKMKKKIWTNCFAFFYCNYYVSRIQELKESFNYGLFCPPSNGKAGKFLDEERRLGDYPFHGPVGYLEVSGFFPLIISLNTIATICNYKSFFVALLLLLLYSNNNEKSNYYRLLLFKFPLFYLFFFFIFYSLPPLLGFCIPPSSLNSSHDHEQ